VRAEYASRTAELEALASGATRATDLKPFRHLNSYGGKFPWDVLNDKVLRASIKRLVGIHFERLESNLQVSDGVTINTAGALETEGCRPHDCKNEAAKIYIGQNGRIFVALLTDRDRLMYFTNDKYNTERIIDPIKRFVDQTPEARVVLMNR
jgi:hypothetical protein